jgi:hypothetical protein
VMPSLVFADDWEDGYFIERSGRALCT